MKKARAWLESLLEDRIKALAGQVEVRQAFIARQTFGAGGGLTI